MMTIVIVIIPLVTHISDGRCRRTNEGKTLVLTELGKVSTFGHEPISRVDGLINYPNQNTRLFQLPLGKESEMKGSVVDDR